MIMVGTIIIIQAVGIDLSALSLLAGALGVGIGFGFQKVTDNLISGLTILVEEPIKVGDRVEVGDVSGDIVNISLRSTTIITNDNISIIVPNSEFISKYGFYLPSGLSLKASEIEYICKKVNLILK